MPSASTRRIGGTEFQAVASAGLGVSDVNLGKAQGRYAQTRPQCACDRAPE